MRILAIMILLFTSQASVLFADHCPEESIAVGRSESHLAGISFERGEFPGVMSRYGPPTSSAETRDPDYPGSGDARYVWQVESARLEVCTMFYHESDRRVESVISVRVEGEAGVSTLQTGRGLRLGDSIDRAIELYGTVLYRGSVNGPTLPGEIRTFCFPDESELSVGVDAKGKVTAMWFAESLE